jgi:hypothetical protein
MAQTTTTTATAPKKRAPVAKTPDDTVRLNIKRIFLDEIVHGKDGVLKTEETREASIANCKLLCTFEGPATKDAKVTGFKPFKKVYFHVERNANPHFALVELKGMEAEEYLDPDTGEDTGEYYIILTLGQVLDHNLPKPA